MDVLEPNNVAAFMERFANCYDAVIRSFEMSYARSNGSRDRAEVTPARVTIILSVRDRDRNGGWCKLTLSLDDVQELNLNDRALGHDSVLSDGLKIRWFDGYVFVEFFDEDRDLDTPEGFRQSKRYVAARQLAWETCVRSEGAQ